MRPAALFVVASIVALGGCERHMRNMYDQPRLDAGESSALFADRLASRPPPEGSVPAAQGDLAVTSSARRGGAALQADDAAMAASQPPTATAALLQRGRERHDIYCEPCHGSSGDGAGQIVRRGFPAPPSYGDGRLRAADDRALYDTIGNGHGVMLPFADRVAPTDRWAIVSWVRELQRRLPDAPAAQAGGP